MSFKQMPFKQMAHQQLPLNRQSCEISCLKRAV